MQVLRQKLHHVSTILDGTMRTVNAIFSHAETLWPAIKDIPLAQHEMFLGELRNISCDLLGHQATTAELLNVSTDISATVCLHIHLFAKTRELLIEDASDYVEP